VFTKLTKTFLGLSGLIIALMLVSCSNHEANSETVAGSLINQIPEDGVIEQEIFETIKQNQGVGVFNGHNQHIDFQWLFMGSNLNDPKTENLMINFSNAQTAAVREALNTEYVQEFSFASLEAIAGEPSLTFYLPTTWDVDEVVIYHHDEGAVVAVATVDQTHNTIVTFTPTTFRGLFYIVGIDDVAEITGEATLIANFLAQNSEISANATNERQNLNTLINNSVASSGLTVSNETKSDNSRVPTPPEAQIINEDLALTATLMISVQTLLNNLDLLEVALHPLVPASGLLMASREVTFFDGESVFDVLQRETRNAGIHMVHRRMPAFNSVYIESIGNLGEFDAGSLSGWVYKVNGWGPNFGASQYILEQGDVIEWHFTVDLGRDVGIYVGN